MSYRLNTRNRGIIVVNNKDEILQLLRDDQIGPDTPVLDMQINLKLKVKDIISPKDFKLYIPTPVNSISNVYSTDHPNTLNQTEQNGNAAFVVSYILTFMSLLFILSGRIITLMIDGKYNPINVAESLGPASGIFSLIVVITFCLINIVRSRKFRKTAALIFSIILLCVSAITVIPNLGDGIKATIQYNEAKKIVKVHFDNLLGHSQPIEIEFNQEKFGDGYLLLQTLNQSYSDFYNAHENYLNLSKGVNNKDYEKSQKNINEIIPAITDCSKKYKIFVSSLEDAAVRYNVNIKKSGKNVDNYTEEAKGLVTQFYSTEKIAYEAIIKLRDLLKNNQGAYQKVGTAYLFKKEDAKNLFNTLIAQYNEYSQKAADCSTKMKHLEKGEIVDIVRK